MKKRLISIICLLISMTAFAVDGNHYSYVPKSPEATKSNYDYNLMSSESEGVDATMYHNEGGKNKTIFWESRKGLLLSNGKRQSAATRLEHEFDHYVDDVKNHKKHSDRAEETDDKYKNKEERRVITGNEALTARKKGECIRYDHKGTTFNAKNSISIY